MDAYKRLAELATPESYIVLGELFFDYKADCKRLSSLFGRVQERPSINLHKNYKMLILSDPKKEKPLDIGVV